MSRYDLHTDQPVAGSTFQDRYKYICIREGLNPFRPALPKLSKHCLELNLDVISKGDLIALLHTLVNDDSLISIRLESRLLKDNPQLTHDVRKIHLHSNNLRLPVYTDPDVMSAICNALHRHLARNELNLKVVRINGIPIQEEHLATICSGLQTCKTLRLLSFEGVPLSTKHLDVMLPVLPTSLEILNLVDCHLGTPEAFRISQYLQRDKHLQRLILNANPVGDAGIESLMRSLRGNKTFRALDVQNCGLTSVGCMHLQELLEANPSMEVCDIRRNPAISRTSALTIAKIILDNNKYHTSAKSFRPLSIDMAPPIDSRDLVSKADNVRAQVPSREFSLSRLKPQEPLLSNAIFVEPHKEPPPAMQESVSIPRSLISKLETSLIKFQVLIDYLGSQNMQNNLEHLGGGSSRAAYREATKADEKEVERNQKSKQHRPMSTANSSHGRKQSDKISEDKIFDSKSLKSYSDSFAQSSVVSSSFRNTIESIGPSQKENSPTTSASSSSSTRETKSGSTVRKTSSKQKSTTEQQGDNDATITTDHEMDSFEFNFGNIGGITKESSYLRIADEIFDDPKILESTRASTANISAAPDSRKSSSRKSSDDTNVEQLEERLRNIQTSYNVVVSPLKALGKSVQKAEKKQKIRIDDISISESWIDEAKNGSVEFSDLSVGSSYSGELTGSDLEKF